MKRRRRILVIRPDRIGDTVCATPLIRGLRETFPDAFIAAMVRPQVKPVLEQNPHLDLILTDDMDGADAGREGFRRKRTELRSHRFDTALMLLPTERHTWMTFLAGIRTRIGVGTRPYHILSCTRRVSRKKYIEERHEADYCLDLGRAIGVRHDDLSEEVFVSSGERDSTASLLTSLGIDLFKPLISIHPESGKSAPNWAHATYAEFIRQLLARSGDIQVMVNLTPSNEEGKRLFERIDAGRVFLPNNGGDLRVLMAIIAHASVVVSASTGPMHLAAGLKRPTVSLFCPLPACSPKLWGPKGNSATIIESPREFCTTHCGNDPHSCTFEKIGIPEVRDAVIEMLKAD